ncbi:MAG: hypothetical protein EBZ74_12980, partial [Planctomycetia bacterium]|nr:hypothetical protein [Planctomycetia bacterium]
MIFIDEIYKIVQCLDCFIFLRFFYHDDCIHHQIQLEKRIRKLGIVFIKLAQWYASFSQEKEKNWYQICMKFQTQSYPPHPFPFHLRNHPFFRENNEMDWKNDVDCIASGSIGTVYRINQYAIKIQHPWVLQEFRVFTRIFQKLQWILWWFQKSIPMHEFYDLLEGQFDFRREAENLDMYHRLYQKESPYIIFPKVYYVEKTILITEYIPPFCYENTERRHQEQEKLERYLLLKCWVLDQIMVKRVFHGDLHEGNWSFTEKGIVIYDFGYVFHLDTFSKELYSDMLSNNPILISKALLCLFDMDMKHQPKIIEWIKKFKGQDEHQEVDSSSKYSLVLEILKQFIFQKMILMNRRLFFLFNLMMIMKTIHKSLPFFYNNSFQSCYFLLQKKNIL